MAGLVLTFSILWIKAFLIISSDALIQQIPQVKRLDPSYSDYSNIKVPEGLYGKEQMMQARKLPA